MAAEALLRVLERTLGRVALDELDNALLVRREAGHLANQRANGRDALANAVLRSQTRCTMRQFTTRKNWRRADCVNGNARPSKHGIDHTAAQQHEGKMGGKVKAVSELQP